VTTGASNLEELNLLMKEVSLRRKKEEVLNLPPQDSFLGSGRYLRCAGRKR